MIKLEKPKFDQGQIINDCIMNLREGTLKQHISDSTDEIIRESKQYDLKACSGNLSSIMPRNSLNSGATKEDMVKIYDQKFASKGQGGRKYYDSIKLLAPNDRCPYCAQREVSTLDHYLPKSKYPIYAVTPYNLIPVCSECNKNKKARDFLSRDEEIIHPYYDDFTDEKWITADMIEGEPIAFEFDVKCPENWEETKKKRAHKHFDEFKLNKLYKSYAAEEFQGCLNGIKRVYRRGGKELAIDDLNEQIEDRNIIRKNTWQAAMYQAIIESEWFWNTYLPGAI